MTNMTDNNTTSCIGYSQWAPTVPQGWECPKCHRVYSPSTVMCLHCPVTAYTYTYPSQPYGPWYSGGGNNTGDQIIPGGTTTITSAPCRITHTVHHGGVTPTMVCANECVGVNECECDGGCGYCTNECCGR